MKKELAEAGKIVNTHALRGEVRVFPYSDDAEFLCSVKKFYIDGAPYPVASARVHKGQALLRFQQITSIEQAESLIGKILWIKKEEVPLEEGRYYVEDIIGLRVEDADSGFFYGTVTEVFQTGANDVFEVTDEKKIVRLVPKIDSVIIKIDLKEGVIKIRPLPGLFE